MATARRSPSSTARQATTDSSVALSPDGHFLAVGGFGRVVRLWDVRTRKLVHELDQGGNGAFTLEFSPDGRTLAISGYEPAASLWDVASGTQIGPPLTAGDRRTMIDLSADGRQLLEVHGNGQGAVWDVDPESWKRRACDAREPHADATGVGRSSFPAGATSRPAGSAGLPGQADRAVARSETGVKLDRADASGSTADTQEVAEGVEARWNRPISRRVAARPASVGGCWQDLRRPWLYSRSAQSWSFRAATTRRRTREEVATDFLQAYGALDADQAITHLADDADVSQMIDVGRGIGGTLDDFRRLVSWLEAEGYEQTLRSCEELVGSASGTDVRCMFDFHAIRAHEIGRGPFSGSYFDLTVRGGKVVRASQTWATGQFSAQMWEPFAHWVAKAHNKDAAVMYEDDTTPRARLTEKSIRLWERHSRGYVDEMKRRRRSEGGMSVGGRPAGRSNQPACRTRASSQARIDHVKRVSAGRRREAARA